MRRTHITRWPPLHGGTALSMLLVATLTAPVAAAAWGARLSTVFGIGRLWLLAAAAALAACYVGSQWRRHSWGGARAAMLRVLVTGALAGVLGRIIEVRTSAFYTEEALFEGVALLLGIHVAAGALRFIARRELPVAAREARHHLWHALRRRPDARPVTATAFADFVTDGVVLLVATAWVLTALNARDAAFAVMFAAGASELLVPVLRLPDALRALPRWRLPVIAFIPLLLGGGGTGPDTVSPAASHVTSRPAVSLRLNIPAFRLDLLHDSTVAASYDVAVGTRKYRTPVGAFAVYRIVWNPWWVPPPSEWARKDTVMPPGPSNPMGRVKLLLGGTYFVHGTPLAASIGGARSHGCIRMRNQDAIDLARRLQASTGAGPDDDELLYLLADTVSLVVDLAQPVPVEIGYAIAEVRADTMLLHPDVYGRVPGRARDAAMQALLAAGRDTTAVRARVLASFLRRSRSRHVAIPLDSLLTGPAPAPSIVARIP